LVGEGEGLVALRIGMLGGTFNPVHLGHLLVAQDAYEELELDRVLFIPAATPPHKTVHEIAEPRHRLAMLEAAVEGDPRFAVSPLELERPGVSYSIDTVQAIRERNPGAHLFFLIGADTLFELHTWKRIEELLTLCEFATVTRPGYAGKPITAETLRLPDPWPERLAARHFTSHPVDISSSDIRMRLAEGLSIRYLVPAAVEMYICEHHLYGA
jgi:nicotinate-nucleotide adenylyltransferase